ncbi:uncharacterized protein LOC132184455 [Corylus avellana]|uniref:uncharacterized protein LOC132184455 n=1 Tax=Corylus avellana TaxID=13451 RepID=UPI00286A48C2|nr:uncharacterized protein LOC132184455 [Corylus avellana]
MSMLDSFFNKGFKAAKCKTLLKLTIPRIKLLRNRREIQIKQMRRDIAKLLETGQEATARIRVEHIVREENMMAAQEIIELFSELISVRLPIIESQRECPLDLKEAISSVCFAAPRCADLPELLQVQMLFATKYGKEFVSAASELMPDCGVNRQLIELLSVRAPSPEKKLKLLKEIAEEHELDWDPAASETEFFKTHEDLLNGSTQFVSGSKLPLPKEKHDETLYSTTEQSYKEQPESDSGFDALDLPEVPKVSLQPSASVASAPAVVPSFQAAQHPIIGHESPKHSGVIENSSQEPHLEPEEVMQERSVANKNEQPSVPAGVVEDKQFVPFISAPSLSSASFSATQSNPPATSFISPPSLSSASFSATQSNPPATLSRAKSEANVDFQDVLAAAQAAAESAERAAAAARSAASLAQVRINELTKKSSDQFLENSSEERFDNDIPDQSGANENPHYDHQSLFGNSNDVVVNSPEPHLDDEDSQRSETSSFDTLKVDFDSSLPNDHGFENELARHHQPQRLPSMDDDPYFSYPNLFTSQNPGLGSAAHSSSDNSRSTHEV